MSFGFPGTRLLPDQSYAALDLSLPGEGVRKAILVQKLRMWFRAQLIGAGGVLSVALGSHGPDGSYEELSVVPGSRFDAPGVDAWEAPINADVTGWNSPLKLQLLCNRGSGSGGGSDRPSSLRSLADCYPEQAIPFEVRGLETTLREDVPPTGAARGGTLLTDKPAPATAGLDYSASDYESGLLRIEARVDGAVVAAKDLKSTCSYADFTVCPTDDRGSLVVDTRELANGAHRVSLRVIDAAGNLHDEDFGAIDVHNRLVAPPGSQGATIGLTQLTARFAKSSQRTLIVPFGRAVAIRGRLTRADGSLLANARVDVLERLSRAGAGEKLVGSARTRADGTSSHTLQRNRPPRVVRLAHGSTAFSIPLRIRVRAASTLKASLRGTLLRYGGRVISGPIPRRGKRVVLQGKAPGFDWTSFARMRTDRRGRFSGRYRLPIRRPGVRLQIRALVPTERGYPYLSFTGRPTVLRVP